MKQYNHEWHTGISERCRKCGTLGSQLLEEREDYISALMAGYECAVIEYALDDANLLIDWSDYGFLNNDEIRSAMLNGFPVSEDNH